MKIYTMRSPTVDRVLQVLIGILFVALVYVVTDGIREPVVVVGDTAPRFSVVTDSGLKVSRSEFGGKLLVLNFWATWCPPCIEELPSLNALHRQFSPSGLVVLGVSVDRNESVYRNFLKRANIEFLTARDPNANISADYGTFKYPETYVIDRNGKVVLKIISSTNWTDEKMVSYIKSLL